MKSIIITLVIGVFVMVSGLQAIGEELTAEQKEVWKMVQGGVESIKKGDLESFMASRHEKSLTLYSKDPLPLNYDQIRTSYAKWFAGDYKPTLYEVKPITINIVSNVATIFYNFKWEAKEVGFSSKGRVMATFIKQNNKWIFVWAMSASCDKPAPCPYGW